MVRRKRVLYVGHRLWVRVRVLGFLLAAASLLQTSGGGRASQSEPTTEDLLPGVAKLMRVDDQLFPRKLVGQKPSEFLLTLRFLPSATAKESQIVISKILSGGFAVTYYSLPMGSKSIAEQFTQITLESKTSDPLEIARRIKVDVRKVDVPPSLIARQMNGISRLTLSPLEELDARFVHMDATTYQFWLQRVGDPVEFYVCLTGEVYGDKRKFHPLVRWMNEMKSLVEKYAGPD